jgi:hypothetical protein
LESSTVNTTRNLLAADLLGILGAVNATPSITLPSLNIPFLEPQGVVAYKNGVWGCFATSLFVICRQTHWSHAVTGIMRT